jgi:hypothetical protein
LIAAGSIRTRRGSESSRPLLDGGRPLWSKAQARQIQL